MRTCTSLVGRLKELAVLRAALDDARSGEGRVIVIEGEAGIGKTHLAKECLAIAGRDGFQVGFGRAWDGPGAPPFYMWLAAFESLGCPLEPRRALAGDADGFVAIERVTRHAQSIARDQPAVLVLDDLQWAGVPTLLALRMLARGAFGRVAVIGTLRMPEPVSESIDQLLQDVLHEASTVVTLTGLHERDLLQLPESCGTDANTLAEVHRVSGGNPFFAKALLLDTGACAALAARGDVLVPARARALLSNRFAMSAGAVEIIACAALGPQPALDTQLVARAAGSSHTAVEAAFDAALAQGMLARAADGGYVFAHDLMRAAAAEQLTAARRAQLHAAWADVLEEMGDPQRTVAAAFQAMAADPLAADARTRERAFNAGMLALADRSYADATALLEFTATADQAAGRSSDAAHSLAHLAYALTYGGEPDRGRQAAERAVSLARQAANPVAFARAALALTLKRQLAVANTDAIAVLDEALRGLDASPASAADVALRCQVEARLASALQPLVDPDRALRLARSALSRARATRDDRVLARILNAARPAFRPLDSLEERLDIDSELLHLATRYGDAILAAQARERLCFISIERGDAAALDGHLDAYGQLADELRLAQHELGVTSLRGLRAIIRGDVADARALIEHIEVMRPRWSAATPVVPPADRAFELRAALSLATGDPEGIRALARQPIPRLRSKSLDLLAAVRAGNTADAAELYAGLVDTLLSPESANFMSRAILANAMVFVGDNQCARQLYDLLGPYAGRHVIWSPCTVYDGSIDRLRALLARLYGDHEAAAAHFADALRSEEAFGASPFAERTRCERDAAARDDGSDRLDERALRIKQAWGLTKRQLEVVLLLVRGESNRGIAEQLGCAERTVEVHVTAVLRKAGVVSRTELAAQFWTSN